MATKKQLEQFALEQRYRFFVKISVLLALIVIVFIDAVFANYDAPSEVELALIAIVGGIESREIIKKRKLTGKVFKK